MLGSTTGQNNVWPALAGYQSYSPASWGSSLASPAAANGVSPSTDQSAANGASGASQSPPFDSMMATLLQTKGISNGTAGSGVSDDVQFASGQTPGGSLLGDLQSLLSILPNRDASPTAADSTGAASAANASAGVDALKALVSGSVQGVANGIEPGASDTTYPTTGTPAAPGNTAASIGATAQTTLPPWAAGWFNTGDSTEAATTGWADAFGQQSGTTLTQQFAQAASAYAATSNASNPPSVTDVTA